MHTLQGICVSRYILDRILSGSLPIRKLAEAAYYQRRNFSESTLRKKLESTTCNPSVTETTAGITCRKTCGGYRFPKCTDSQCTTARAERAMPKSIRAHPIASPRSSVKNRDNLVSSGSPGRKPSPIAKTFVNTEKSTA